MSFTHLKQLTGLGRQQLRLLARTITGELRRWDAQHVPPELLDWGRRFLPNHFAKPPSGMHRWLGARLDLLEVDRGVKLNVIGPRGGAKSTIGSLAFLLRAALEGHDSYIWLVSDTTNQAIAHLENVKAELIGNQRLRQAYPEAAGEGPVWRKQSIRLKNGVTIEAIGTGQRVRGKRARADRPTLIVCDDLQNDGHMRSRLQRENSAAWFQGTLLKAGTKQTNIVNLATALHRDALALQLHRTPGWTSEIFRAIIRWPDNMSLWAEWEQIYCDLETPGAVERAATFYTQHKTDMDAGAQLQWPDEEDLYTLMRMRVEGGRAAFEREKQGSPFDPALCEWPEDYFGENIWFDQWPNDLALRVVAIDPSKGADARRGDYSAIVSLGVDQRGLLYIDADLARRTTMQMVADGVAICRRFSPDGLGIESNQFQELLAGEFAAELVRQNCIGLSPWLIDNRVNKLVRIRRIGPLLATGRLRFKTKSPGAAMLVDQLRTFPHGDHDDGPDALEMALRLAGDLLAGRNHNDGLTDRLPLNVPQ